MRVYGAVPGRCPNGCGVSVSHLTPELIAILLRVNVPRDLPLATGYCRTCETIVRVRWKDFRVTELPRAA